MVCDHERPGKVSQEVVSTHGKVVYIRMSVTVVCAHTRLTTMLYPAINTVSGVAVFLYYRDTRDCLYRVHKATCGGTAVGYTLYSERDTLLREILKSGSKGSVILLSNALHCIRPGPVPGWRWFDRFSPRETDCRAGFTYPKKRAVD